MSKVRLPVILLLVLQIVAFIIYPPSYFERAPQAAVLPPALLLLFIGALVGFYTKALSPENTRNSLVFVQGINIVVRLMTLFPNLRKSNGDWAWALLLTQLVGMALSWYAMTALDDLSLRALRRRQEQRTQAS